MTFSEKHGVGGEFNGSKVSLASEKVHLSDSGILGALCMYFSEPADVDVDLKSILYNLPFVHRAFSLTFTSVKESFVPIKNEKFIKHPDEERAWFSFELKERVESESKFLKFLPDIFEKDGGISDSLVLRTKKRIELNGSLETQLGKFRGLNKTLREHLHFISGPTRLWYLKVTGSNLYLKRSQLTLILAGMHRLSEMSRYDPQLLGKHLESQHNWLLSEFIGKSSEQFINEISCEITGDEFGTPSIVL